MTLTLLWLCGTNLQCLQGVQSPGQGGEGTGQDGRPGQLGQDPAPTDLIPDLLKEISLTGFLMYTVQGRVRAWSMNPHGCDDSQLWTEV